MSVEPSYLPTCTCSTALECIHEGCENCCDCEAPFKVSNQKERVLILLLNKERDRLQAENLKLRKEVASLKEEVTQWKGRLQSMASTMLARYGS